MRSFVWSIVPLVIAGAAAAADDGIASAPLSEIASCALAGPAITLRDDERRALLDAADRDRVQTALVERYPALQRDGFASPYILLWQRGGRDWLYVSLIASSEAPTPLLCFTATFTAGAFGFTRELLRKYFDERGPSA